MNKMNQIILDLKKLNDDEKNHQEEYKSKKKMYEEKIIKFLGKKNEKSYDFTQSNRRLKATFVENKKIDFNVEMIEQVVDKNLFEEFVDKTYTISDYEGLVKYLKSLGANPKVFKEFIHCEKQINKSKLNQLSELGDISLDDLEGCYSVSVMSSYVRITETELEESDE